MNRKYKFFSILFCTFLLLASCKKGIFDYRKDYVGAYLFQYDYLSRASFDTAIVYIDTTYVYSAEVHLGGEGQLHFDWYNGSYVTFEVTKKGILSHCGKEIGSIDSKKFHLLYDDDVCSPGPADTNYFTHVDGIKK